MARWHLNRTKTATIRHVIRTRAPTTTATTTVVVGNEEGVTFSVVVVVVFAVVVVVVVVVICSVFQVLHNIYISYGLMACE